MIDGAEAGADLLKGLAHPIRLMALCYIGEGEMAVQDLADNIGTTQSNISQHLAKLRTAGIVAVRRQDNKVFYRVANPAALELIQVLQKTYCPV
ncbi:MAG: helix-turn-helix transcriptional regulator [Fibrobacteria bacterium]|nr:helix-turn-helix transcriptional regulator [Fibrobacteria bacterium]